MTYFVFPILRTIRSIDVIKHMPFSHYHINTNNFIEFRSFEVDLTFNKSRLIVTATTILFNTHKTTMLNYLLK